MKLLYALLILALTSNTLVAAPDLVANGRAQAEIIIAEKPARMTNLAARELQTYIERISGTKLSVGTKPTPGRNHIFVGQSSYTDALKLSTAGLEHGAFRMASGADWLALIGPDEDYLPIEPWGRDRSTAETNRVNAEWDKVTGEPFWNNCRDLYQHYRADLGVWDYDDTGTLNAVYEFLRSLGVRWYAPGDLGEVVPQQQTIALPKIDRTVKPDFALRKFMFYTDHTGIGDKAIWGLRLGLNQGAKIIGVGQPCHGIKFVLMRDEMKKAHPEFYLSIDGKRDLNHKGVGVPNLLEPRLADMHLKYARAMLDYYRQPAINIDLVDGYSGLNGDDPAWQAQLTPGRGWRGSMSDHVFSYMNRVALALNESHPDRLVCALAYGNYTQPPEKIEKMSPNLAIIETRSRMTFWDEANYTTRRENREAWLKKLPSGKYFTWDTCANGRPDTAGRPAVFTRQIARDLHDLKGVTMGEMIEIYDHPAGNESTFGYDPFALDHLNLYVTTRYWWNADQNLDALLAEYYQGYYGPAAAPMKALLEFCEANWMSINQDAEKIGRTLELLATAQAAAPEGSTYRQRIDKIAAFVNPLRALQEQLGRKHDTDLSFRVLLTSNVTEKSMKDKPLDGTLPKDFWPDVRVSPLLPLRTGTRAKANSNVRIFREGDVLYIGIHCDEPDMKNVAIGTPNPDDPKLFDGDFVTLLLETPSRSYYEIAVNPAGAVLESDHGPNGAGLKWTSTAQVAVHRGDKEWTVEIRLPIAGDNARLLDPLKGVDGAQPKDLFPWYFNVCRQRVRGSEIERTAFSPTGTDEIRVPEKFAKLWGK